jgi:hypothetical protein
MTPECSPTTTVSLVHAIDVIRFGRFSVLHVTRSCEKLVLLVSSRATYTFLSAATHTVEEVLSTATNGLES